MSEVETQAKASKKETVYEAVTMADGRVVQFPGNRQVDKTIETDIEGKSFSLRFDFRNGQTRTLSSSELDVGTILQAAAHGAGQKTGDSWASIKEVDDMVLACDEMYDRLRKGEWFKAGEGSGDSLAGASVVIKAIVEATGKDIAFVKDFLNKKLEAAKAKGEKLSRQELYNSFRNPATKTGAIIKRLEEEKLSKSNKVDSGALLAEITG